MVPVADRLRPADRWRDAPYMAALRWANQQRMARGEFPVQDLRRGKPDSPGHCALANTIGARVINGDGSRLVLKFIDRFDKRRYPHLIERG